MGYDVKFDETTPLIKEIHIQSEHSALHTEFEHHLGVWQAIDVYRPAVFWCIIATLTVVLNGFDNALIGSLISVESFAQQFGRHYGDGYVISAAWLGAFNYAAMLGGATGSLGAGILYDSLGPKRTLGLCVLGSIGAIFLQFLSSTPAVLFLGLLANGILVGFFPVIASAYIGEICPVVLRGIMGSMVNLGFVVGQLIAAGLLKATEKMESSWAYKMPLASQWILPLLLLVFLPLMPESPWWLVRKGRIQKAKKALDNLSTTAVNTMYALANIEETLSNEQSSGEKVNVLDCFKGTNLRRLIIAIMAYQLQPLTGNVFFVTYSVYFFTNAGLSISDAFSLKLWLTIAGFVATLLAWPVMSWTGRRPILIAGTAALTLTMFLIGVLDLDAIRTSSSIYAQSMLMVFATIVYDLSTGPLCFVILCEIPAPRVRGITIAIASILTSLSSVIITILIPYGLNIDELNWGGKVGFVFMVLGALCTTWCFFCLPESKGRTFEELDILFEREVSSRKFEDYDVLEGEEESVIMF
ncbi:related to transporter (major facilitator superfamily) [Phialocephala subalpina]|uniref:Related to transporter (Major facilitator superfamily) n=1 Tax=Phialocephala subalpina TaxID=576137 RepID=A0A1L7XWH2_9HELO|nr:related to transporter (major facilitator superfamily) [Phialocephala subalpina]